VEELGEAVVVTRGVGEDGARRHFCGQGGVFGVLKLELYCEVWSRCWFGCWKIWKVK
jgi:hypothetical protein